MTAPLNSEPSHMAMAVLGAITSAFELVTLGHIADRVKIQKQVHVNKRISYIPLIREMYRGGGYSEFYKGLRHNLLVHCPKNAFRWVAYSYFDNIYSKIVTTKEYPLVKTTIVAFSVAIAESTFIVCPAEAMKTREMTQATAGKINAWSVFKMEGIRAFTKGWTAVTLKSVVSWQSYLISYDLLWMLATKRDPKKEPSFLNEFAIGAVAGLINAFVKAPLDRVKTDFQKDKTVVETKNFIQVMQKIVHTEGVRALWRGLLPNAVHSMWYSAVVLTAMRYYKVNNNYG